MNKKIELLAPASNLKSVIAAVNSGCDAIYIGGKLFNARAYADSPDNEQLKEIIDLCHLRGVKVFITLNTMYKNNEINELLEFAHYLYEAGADAFIVQDMGFLLLAEKHFPDIEIHCSTQMTIHNTSAAVFFDEMGVDRVVLSRELSLAEIKEINNNINCDCECFIHGALCVSYSGRCLMSSIFGGRSGNRGRCAQPCRMEYSLIKNDRKQQNGYLISTKDISTIEMTNELIDAGIYSFKIEGRMKSPEYVVQVVSSYRDAIDGKTLTRQQLTDLQQIFNRGGKSGTGYYNCFAGNKMLSLSPKSSGIKVGSIIKSTKKGCIAKFTSPLNCGDGIEIWNKKRENTGCGISSQVKAGDTLTLNIYGEAGSPVYKSYDKALNDRLKKESNTLTRQMEIDVSFKAEKNKPMCLTLLLDEKTEITGDIPQTAENKPLTKEDFISRLQKTGGTPFKFNFIDTSIEDNLFVPITSLNQLKRQACETAEKQITESCRRKTILPQINFTQSKLTRPQKLTVFVENINQLNSVLKFNPFRIYVELNADTIDGILNSVSIAHSKGIELYAALPRIARNDYCKVLLPIIERLESSEIDGYLLRNFNSIKTRKPVMYDYCFNIANSITADYFNTATLSPELNAKDLKAISGDNREIVIYGHLVLMSTHQCPVGNGTGKKDGKFCCERNNKDTYYLKDRIGAMLPVLTHCHSCTAFILNNAPVYILHRWNEITAVGAEFMRLDFTIEKPDEVENILQAYTAVFTNKKGLKDAPSFNHTCGHYFRGVQ